MIYTFTFLVNIVSTETEEVIKKKMPVISVGKHYRDLWLLLILSLSLSPELLLSLSLSDLRHYHGMSAITWHKHTHHSLL